MNLKVAYPPTYQPLVWNLKKSDNDAVKGAAELKNWNFFSIMLFQPKSITIDDKDPPWMNEYIKRKILDKKIACKSFNTNKRNYDANRIVRNHIKKKRQLSSSTLT